MSFVLAECPDDVEFCEKRIEKGLLARLQHVRDTPFKRITYTEAVEVLNDPANRKAIEKWLKAMWQKNKQGKPGGLPKEKTNKGKFFNEDPQWGIDLGSEHERCLTECLFKKPTVVYNYPKDIKAFYMRLNDDGKTVGAADMLVPGIGELIGGSAREEREDVLLRRMKEMNVDPSHLSWYVDLRRYGSVPHAGFGLGFERLVLFCTGVDNIRDVIPFPRYPGNCTF